MLYNNKFIMYYEYLNETLEHMKEVPRVYVKKLLKVMHLDS